MDDTDHYRCRLISLRQSADESKQAEAACDALAEVEGVLLAAPFDSCSIHLIYSLDQVSLGLVTDLLDELGFEMDKSILVTVRKTIYQFLDANARDNMHIDVTSFQEETDETPEIPHRSSEKYWDDYH
ncbi:MAG: hypothetical protein O7F15_00920 [Gammaproteobacteria bacterium]|nr:hypothetical protein [Gammaproteobacteria bacterium]